MTVRAAVVAVALALSNALSAAGTLSAGSGEPAPSLALRDIDGREVRLDAFRGRTVIVNFWATWCAPCVAEMPSLERLRDALAEDGAEVLAVNLQENAARIRPFAEKLGLSMPLLRDHDGSARKAWDVRVFPTTFVVGPDQHLGGLSSGGLGMTDSGRKETIGGLSREFYHRLYQHYQKPEAWKWQKREEYGNRGQGTPALDGTNRTMWVFEPHVAEATFEAFVDEFEIPVVRNEWLDRKNGVKKDGERIASIIDSRMTFSPCVSRMCWTARRMTSASSS